ncbi:c-type cytochrome [Neptunicoccus cionae]|uniref:c-type cytochrome n=1 Tax=Neptunicoccus cionae TaxID=2035344 RepID=UPI000C76C4BD|nr:cytochrome c [Amylibacter cionae]MBR9863913.1 cytochrome c [Paracoccaceae bacterium]PLS20673.1 cytochrome C554 [Amylibacter cionae]
MKTILATTATALVLSAGVFSPAVANEAAIKARQSLMQLYAFNLGQLGAMAKGTMEYDSGAAQAAADNLLAAASMNQMAMWPEGSDNVAMAGKTAALPEIWTTFPKITESSQALVAAAESMASVAGNDLDSLRGAMGEIGKSCGGCHKSFRASND